MGPIHWFDVPIGPSKWSVLLSVPGVSPALDDEGEFAHEGYCSSQHSRIYVNASLPRDRWPDIVVHELLHAVIYVTGIDTAFGLDLGKEEKLVSQMTPTLCDMLLRGGMLKIPRAPKTPRSWRRRSLPTKGGGSDVEVTMLDAKAKRASR